MDRSICLDSGRFFLIFLTNPEKQYNTVKANTPCGLLSLPPLNGNVDQGILYNSVRDTALWVKNLTWLV